MNRRSIYLTVASIALVAGPIAAQTVSERVDAYVATEMAKRKIPGMAVAIVRGGKIEKVGSYGKASLELGNPVTPTTIFQINSATKSFTGVGVMMLVQAGQVRLDDPIGNYLDQLPGGWRPITVRQLLTHTSGLPDIVESPNTGTMLARTIPDALRILAEKPMDFAAGAKWSYNQTNYLLLGMLIEKVSGLPWARFCLEKELAPLGITTARFGDSRTVVPGRATGYTKYRLGADKVTPLEQVENTWYEFEPFLYTAAALNLSASDFAVWVQALLSGKLLTRANLDEIWKPTVLADGKPFHFEGSPMAYGLGWPLLDRPKHRAAGGEGGNRAAFYIYPDDGLAIIVLTNLLGADPSSLVEGIAAIYLPDLKGAE